MYRQAYRNIGHRHNKAWLQENRVYTTQTCRDWLGKARGNAQVGGDPLGRCTSLPCDRACPQRRCVRYRVCGPRSSGRSGVRWCRCWAGRWAWGCCGGGVGCGVAIISSGGCVVAGAL